jgi:hypothetical protein
MRVLRALASFGVFAIKADGTVAHSARSRLLRTDMPNSLPCCTVLDGAGLLACLGATGRRPCWQGAARGCLGPRPLRSSSQPCREGTHLRRDDGELSR